MSVSAADNARTLPRLCLRPWLPPPPSVAPSSRAPSSRLATPYAVRPRRGAALSRQRSPASDGYVISIYFTLPGCPPSILAAGPVSRLLTGSWLAPVSPAAGPRGHPWRADGRAHRAPRVPPPPREGLRGARGVRAPGARGEGAPPQRARGKPSSRDPVLWGFTSNGFRA